MDCSILVLHSDLAEGVQLAEAVKGPGLNAEAAEDIADAIRHIARGQCHLVAVDTSVPKAISFLAKCREKAPHVRRALIETGAASAVDWQDVINRAAICAILTPPLDREQIVFLAKEIAGSGQAAAPSADNSAEVEKLKAKIADLEKKLKKTERDLNIARNADEFLREEEFGVEELRNKQRSSPLGQEIEVDYHANDMKEEIGAKLFEMLNSPNVELPVLPQVAMELQKMMKSDDVEFDKVAELVSMEAGISARILSICNSPLYAGADPISNLNQAVARLGVKAMRDVVQTAAVENLFKSEYKGMEDLMSKLWMHNLATAHANQMVAEALGIEEAEDFFVMGLLHDIGKILIASLIQQGFNSGLWNIKIVTPPLALELIQLHHNEIGKALLKKWQYPEALVEVVALHNDDDKIYEHPEHVVVTYYSNALTRKLGYSLVQHKPDILNNHDLAQALNMTPDLADKIEKSSESLVERIKTSYF